jgi:hypothetical protein
MRARIVDGLAGIFDGLAEIVDGRAEIVEIIIGIIERSNTIRNNKLFNIFSNLDSLRRNILMMNFRRVRRSYHQITNLINN